MSNLSKSLSDTPIIKAYPLDQPADAEYQPMHPNLQNAFDASGPRASVKRGPLIDMEKMRKPLGGPGRKKEKPKTIRTGPKSQKPPANLGRRDPASLCHALEAGNEDLADELLSYSEISPDEFCERGTNALHTAAMSDCSPRLFNRILSFTRDVNAYTRSGGNTALMLATFKDNINFVKSLMGNEGVKLNLQNKRGYTALHIAVRDGHLPMVRQLLSDARIDTTLEDYDRHWTPLEMARHSSIAAELRNAQQ